MPIASLEEIRKQYPDAEIVKLDCDDEDPLDYPHVFILNNESVLKFDENEDYLDIEFSIMKFAENISRSNKESTIVDICGKKGILMPRLEELDPSEDEEVNNKAFKDLVLELKALHDLGLWHLDIKPHNIMFDPVTKLPCLIDYGLSEKVEKGVRISDIDHDVCIVGFRPPEAYAEDEENDENIDILFSAHGVDEIEECEDAFSFTISNVTDVYALGFSLDIILGMNLSVKYKRLIRLMTDPNFESRITVDELVELL